MSCPRHFFEKLVTVFWGISLLVLSSLFQSQTKPNQTTFMPYAYTPSTVQTDSLRGLQKKVRTGLPVNPNWGSLDAIETSRVLAAANKARAITLRNRRNSKKNARAFVQKKSWKIDNEIPYGTLLGTSSNLIEGDFYGADHYVYYMIPGVDPDIQMLLRIPSNRIFHNMSRHHLANWKKSSGEMQAEIQSILHGDGE
jgi:hypothetical protein